MMEAKSLMGEQGRAGRGGGGGLGVYRVLQCYNHGKTERFCMIRVLQGCYKVQQGATRERGTGFGDFNAKTQGCRGAEG
jgi:hypothetical protein